MLSSTLIHVAIEWENLDKIWQYVTLDEAGVVAHTEKPYLDDLGRLSSTGDQMYLSDLQRVLFERDKLEPIEPDEPV